MKFDPNQASELTWFPENRTWELTNQVCAYCWVSFDSTKRTRDHVVARRFVPKGTLNGSWNLILNACEACNNKKAKLENDISAVTQFAKYWREPDRNDEYRSDAFRKASSATSPLTRKPVLESESSITATLPLAPLAHMQIRAFYFMLTYKEDLARGIDWQGVFAPTLYAHRANWGNSVHRAFMERTRRWEPRLFGRTKGDHFQVVIRKHPTARCWSWGLEWNHDFRIVGYAGERTVCQQLFDETPRPKGKRIPVPDGELLIIPDVPLDESDDHLFLIDGFGSQEAKV